MKNTSRHLVFLLLLFVQICLVFQSFSQVQTARHIATSANSNGFYEYLPQGYNASLQYPLLVFIHGMGELGNGGSDLSSVLRNGPPRLAANGTLPVSFNVNGTDFKFIIISPQFINWPAPADVNAVIDYATSHYAVNKNRIYLTGLSMGGGAVWEYAGDNTTYGKKLAAIVPVCGASWPEPERAHNIASINLPVWATHNQDDGTVPVFYTNDYVSLINSSTPTPTVLARKTIFPVSGHDAWSRTYDPTFTDGSGFNVYRWMLQFELNAVVLPIVLGEYKAVIENNSSVVIKWNTLSEINNKNFIVEKSGDGKNFTVLDNVAATNEPAGHAYSLVDNKPSAGNNFYRLAQVDKDGKTTYFNILKVIFPVSANQVSFQLMPNPVVNSMNLEMVNPSKGTLQVMLSDVQGHQLRIWNFQKSNAFWQQTVDVSGLPKGNYIIQVKGNNINEVKRFIKQ